MGPGLNQDRIGLWNSKLHWGLHEDVECGPISVVHEESSKTWKVQIPQGPWPAPPQAPLQPLRPRCPANSRSQSNLKAILARAEPAALVLAALPVPSAFGLAAVGAQLPFQWRKALALMGNLQNWQGATNWCQLRRLHQAWADLHTLSSRQPLHSAGLKDLLAAVGVWSDRNQGGEPKLVVAALSVLAESTQYRFAAQLHALEHGAPRILLHTLSIYLHNASVCQKVTRALYVITEQVPHREDQMAFRGLEIDSLLRVLKLHCDDDAVQRCGLRALRSMMPHISMPTTTIQHALDALQQSALSEAAYLEALYLLSYFAHSNPGLGESKDAAVVAAKSACKNGRSAILRGVVEGLLLDLNVAVGPKYLSA